MRKFILIYLLFLCLVSVFELTAQTITVADSEISRGTGNCQYRVIAQTTVNSSMSVVVYAGVDWDLTGFYSGHFENFSEVVNSYGQGVVRALYDQTHTLPTFDDWLVNWFSVHYISGQAGTQTDQGSDTFTFCNFVADDDRCSEIWVKSGYESNDDQCDNSPILIDLAQDGLLLGAPENAIWYDLLGTGEPIFIQWVRAGENDAFLVHDRNGNGFADDGSELFGNGTRLYLEDDKLAPNGFVALAQFDRTGLGGDNDGFITAADDVWPELFLWLDADADGFATPEEMRPLAQAGFTRLETIPKQRMVVDPFGNWLRYWASAAKQDPPSNHLMIDVYFRGGEQW